MRFCTDATAEMLNSAKNHRKKDSGRRRAGTTACKEWSNHFSTGGFYHDCLVKSEILCGEGEYSALSHIRDVGIISAAKTKGAYWLLRPLLATSTGAIELFC